MGLVGTSFPCSSKTLRFGVSAKITDSFGRKSEALAFFPSFTAKSALGPFRDKPCCLCDLLPARCGLCV